MARLKVWEYSYWAGILSLFVIAIVLVNDSLFDKIMVCLAFVVNVFFFIMIVCKKEKKS